MSRFRNTLAPPQSTTSSPLMTTTTSLINFLFTNMTLKNDKLSNDTEDDDDDSIRRTTGELIVGTLTFVVITLMTIGGNTLVILSVFTYRPLNKVQNYFLVSLAASDLAVAVLVTPFHVVKFIIGEWVFGLAFCQVWLTCDILCCTASILNLCAIALDRYWAIHDPIEYASKRTLKLVCCMIAVVWSLSVLISVPPLIGWNDWTNDKLKITCEYTTQKAFVVYSACGSFFIPLIVMTTVYAKIFYAARQRLRNKRRSVRGLSANSHEETGSKKSNKKSMPAMETTALDPTTTTLVQSNSLGQGQGGQDQQSSSLTVSPVTPAGELSERTILLKEQNGNATWSNNSPLQQKSPRPPRSNSNPNSNGGAGGKCRFKKLGLPNQKSNVNLLGVSREPSLRSMSDKDLRSGLQVGAGEELRTTSNAGHVNVQKFIKDRERISVTKEKKAAKTLAVIMGVFVLCWLPFFVMYLVKPFVDEQQWLLHPKVEEAITWLGYINSAINPVIYTIFNLDFRRAFQKFLCPFRPGIGGY